MKEYFTFPAREEIKAATNICCGRFCGSCETPVEYAWRARDVDMSALLDMAIENELTQAEQKAVYLRWFENLSNRLTASALGVSEAVASKTLRRAQAKLHKALRYAVYYQHNINREAVVPAAVERARAVLAARLMNAENFARQIKKERVMRGYDENQVEKYAGIKKGRIKAIENGFEPSPEEKARLCAFFALMPAENETNTKEKNEHENALRTRNRISAAG